MGTQKRKKSHHSKQSNHDSLRKNKSHTYRKSTKSIKPMRQHSDLQELRPKIVDPPALAYSKVEVMIDHQDYMIVNKPYGWLTHNDGATQRPNLVDTLSEQLNIPLKIHQRLDVSTSGVIAFSKTTQGTRILNDALQKKNVKQYLAVVEGVMTVDQGEIKGAVPKQAHVEAHTSFKVLRRGSNWTLVRVYPHTGRTHQIRAHLASLGYPIRGDGLYGDPFDLRAVRCLLHAERLQVNEQSFYAAAPPEFLRYTEEKPSAIRIRQELYIADYNECFRYVHDQGDQADGWRVDRYQDWYWVICNQGASMPDWIKQLVDPNSSTSPFRCKGVYWLDAQVDRSQGQQQQVRLVWGEEAPNPLNIYEMGLCYQVQLGHHLSTGLFLDQRPQRAWIHSLKGELKSVLNTFAHAGGFSIAAAAAGATTVSIDLSKHWLARIPEQLIANGISTEGHRCLQGDVFDWLRRLHKKGETFDLVILDPPSTSIGKTKKRWSAKKDYPELVKLAMPLVNPGGRILTATNHRQLFPKAFAYMVSEALSHDFELERVCSPAVDFASDEMMGIKNLIWRKKIRSQQEVRSQHKSKPQHKTRVKSRRK